MPAKRPVALSLFALLALLALLPAAASAASRPAEQLLVKPRPGASALAFGRALAGVGGQPVGVIPDLGVRVIDVGTANRSGALKALRGEATVAYAQPNGLTPPADVVPNDALWVNQWSQPKTRTNRAWEVTSGAPTVKVAILDSGVDPAQPDLQGRLLAGYDFYNGDSSPADDYGHGTQVAGVAAAQSGNGIGVAGYCGACSILPVKITGSNGYASWSAMASGIAWATDRGARVINLSFAGSSGSTAVAEAIAYARSHGALVTASAGNYGASTPTYPAAYPGALAVASTGATDALESYSNYGSWVQLAAPGCNYGTGRTTSSALFGNFCGTSSAAPALAGIAALAFSFAPTSTTTQIEAALESSATPVGGFVRYGRADAWRTLATLGAAEPTPTVPLAGAAPSIVASNTGPLTSAPQPEELLWTSGGGWSGAPGIGLGFQWSRCDSTGNGCVPIAGATSRTYTPTPADSGHTLRTNVTASNSLGAASAVSPPTAALGGSATETPTEPAPTEPAASTTSSATFTGSISAKQASKSFSLTVGGGEAEAMLTFSKVTSLTLTLIAPDGSTVSTVSGASGIRLTRNLGAGTYRYVVSGSIKKGSASFTLNLAYATP